MGDFNEHLGFIGAQQVNFNGQLIVKLMERWNLTLLNGMDCGGCIGENTREQGGVSSAIDFVLTNQSIFRTFEKLHIDKQRREFDLSDHFLIRTTFLVNGNKINNRKIKSKEVNYYKLNDKNQPEGCIYYGSGERLDGFIGTGHGDGGRKNYTACGGKLEMFIYQEGEERCVDPPYGTGVDDK